MAGTPNQVRNPISLGQYTNAESEISVLGGKAGRILSELENRLSRGRYLFGESIFTADLAEEFNASRAPVATALNHLRSDGYLVITPQVGCRVVSPSKQEIQDFFHLFGKTEGVMAGLAAKRHDENEVENLRDISIRITKASPKKNEDISDNFLDLVGLFHSSIRSMARSPTEARRASNQWRRSEFLLFNGRAPNVYKNLRQANKERAMIVDAIAERDDVAAEKIMERHVRGKPFRTGTLK